MIPKYDASIKRLEQLIQKSISLITNARPEVSEYDKKKTLLRVDRYEFLKFRTSSLHFIEGTVGANSQYYNSFFQGCQADSVPHVKTGKAMLEGLLEEFQSQWLWTERGLANAEFYADLMDMAEELLSAGYKDAAAVIIGAVVEQHMRKLCVKHGIAVTVEKDGKQVAIKAATMNDRLAGLEVYDKGTQKWVTAALDIRNNAAHGHFELYDSLQVKSILFDATGSFLQRQPI